MIFIPTYFKSRLSAIEIVADKRHARMLDAGLTDRQASDKICLFLQGWINRVDAMKLNKQRKMYIIDYLIQVRDGYKEELFNICYKCKAATQTIAIDESLKIISVCEKCA